MGGLVLKLKCHFCGFKSMPIRGDRCRRCTRQIPEAQKRPITKELFRSRAEKLSGSRALLKESTITKMLKKKLELMQKRDEAARLKQQKEAQSQQELHSQQDANSSEKNDKEKPNEFQKRPDDCDSTFVGEFTLVELTDPKVTEEASAKEPPLSEYEKYNPSLSLWKNRDEELEDMLEGNLTGYYTLVDCRSVRIGSYKVIPEEKVILSSVGLWMCIPSIRDAEQLITLTIDIFEIQKVLSFYSKPATLFIYVLPSAVKRIRELLDMDANDGPYFDPLSSDETVKRITLLCNPLHNDMIKAIRNIFDTIGIMEELTSDESNDLLVRSSPKYAPFHSDMVSLFV